MVSHLARRNKPGLWALVAILTTLATFTTSVNAQRGGKQPSGLYVLDGDLGTYRDAWIRDYDFISGYAWRYAWSDIEKSDGVYDWAAVDHIIGRMAAINKKLSWLVMDGTPSYLLNSGIGIATYKDGGETKPSPWDATLQSRYQRFIQALSNHQVADPARGGSKVALKDHSVLAIIHPNIPGLPRSSLRNGESTTVAAVPGFTRDKLAAAINNSAGTWRQYFGRKPLLFSLWPIQDDDRSESELWEFAQNTLVQHRRVGLFQDNLQASKDCSTCTLDKQPINDGLGRVLFNQKAWVGLQALTSWEAPIGDKADNVENTTPFTAMQYAVDTYDCLYFELYAKDYDNTAWQSQFRDWAATLESLAGGN